MGRNIELASIATLPVIAAQLPITMELPMRISIGNCSPLMETGGVSISILWGSNAMRLRGNRLNSSLCALALFGAKDEKNLTGFFHAANCIRVDGYASIAVCNGDKSASDNQS